MGKWSEVPAGDLRKFENELLSALGDDAGEIVEAVKDDPSLARKVADHLRALMTERNIICVDRGTAVTFPDWVKDVLHPELQTTGPAEYNITELELWFDDDQWKSDDVAKGSVIYDHLVVTNTLRNQLGLVDLQAIQAKGVGFFRRHFAGKSIFGWKSVVRHHAGDLYAPYLYERGDKVFLGWFWLDCNLSSSNSALRFC